MPSVLMRQNTKAFGSHLSRSAIEANIRTGALALLAFYATGAVFKVPFRLPQSGSSRLLPPSTRGPPSPHPVARPQMLKAVLMPVFLAMFLSVMFIPVVDRCSQRKTCGCNRRLIKVPHNPPAPRPAPLRPPTTPFVHSRSPARPFYPRPPTLVIRRTPTAAARRPGKPSAAGRATHSASFGPI